MYAQFFGLDKLPFRLRPDLEFLHLGDTYRRSRTQVLGLLSSDRSPILVAGLSGTGKTLLVEDALREVSGRFAVCRINQPDLSASELIQALVLQWVGSPDTAQMPRPSLLKDVLEALALLRDLNRVPLLIVDDAHLLGDRAADAIGNLVAEFPGLRLLLAGRTNDAERLDGLVALMSSGRKPHRVDLGTLSPAGIRAYVDARLAVARAVAHPGGKELFSTDAYAMIFQHTGGAQRLVNVLCDAAMHAACLRAAGQVGSSEISTAVQDPRWSAALSRDKVGPTSTPSAAAGHALATLPAAELQVMHRKTHITTWPVKSGRISIGRALDNDLRLEAEFISRHHCRIVTVDDVSIIEDMGSSNGISVNGVKVKRHVLRHDDRVALGEHFLTYLIV